MRSALISATLVLLTSLAISRPAIATGSPDHELISPPRIVASTDSIRVSPSALGAPWTYPSVPNTLFPGCNYPIRSNSAVAIIQGGSSELDGHWLEMAPPPRAFHTAVYDPVRERVLVIGGYGTQIRNQVWVLCPESGKPWFLLETSGNQLPPLADHSAVYDEAHDRVLVFGGWDGSNFNNETWELSLKGSPRWQKILPSGTLPGPRAGHTSIYDPIRDRVLVFGGSDDSSQPLEDLWELTLSGTPEWKELVAAGDGPGKRSWQTAVYDPLGDRMIVFGGAWYYCDDYLGCVDSREFSDTWALDLSPTPRWVELNPAGSTPPARYQHSASYDRISNRMLVFAGRSSTVLWGYDDLWELSLDDHPVWSRINPGGEQPGTRFGHTAVIDSRREALVMFGGAGFYTLKTDVWECSLNQETSWTRLAPKVGSPPSRAASTVTYDPDHDRMVLFGGSLPLAVYVNDLWEFAPEDPQGWQPLTVSGNPPAPRALHTAALDPVRRRIIVFGGINRNQALGDLWSLELVGDPVWRELVPAGEGPGPRYSHTCVYDPKRDRMIFFGGYDEEGQQNDVWALSLGGTLPTWSEIFPESPFYTGAVRHSAIYDPRRDRMLVFGGSIGPVFPSNETWELTLRDPPKWRKLAPLGMLPSPRASHSAVYDAVRDRMVVFGGSREDGTWALSLAGEPAWRELHPGGSPHTSGGGAHAAAFDPVREQMMVFGGSASGGFDRDTWILDWGVPDRQVVADVSPGNGRKRGVNPNSNATLRVAILSDPPACSGDPGFDATTADPFSLQLGGASPHIPSAAPNAKEKDVNGDGYPDLVVRFKVSQLDVTGFTQPVFLDGETYDGTHIRGKCELETLPSGSPDAVSHLAIDSSPVIRSSDVALELSISGVQPGSVLIELYDVRGRRLSGFSSSKVRAGTLQASLNLRRPITPGVYFARVTQNEQSIAQKIVVVP